jgi:nucleoside-diphosphate-sugar epimerase
MTEPVELPGRLLVTGANGFLGRAVIRQALEHGWTVRGTDLAVRPSVPELDDYVSADILHPGSVASAMTDVGVVIHTAGLAHILDRVRAASAPFAEVNGRGTESVARAAAAAGVRHFILASSVSVYGPHAGSDTRETAPCRPESQYARSKYDAEQRACLAAGETGMGVTLLRLATLYGPSDPGNMAHLMTSIMTGRFVWIGRGRNRKSLLERDDAARACLLAARQARVGVETYNVSAPACSMQEIVAAIGRAGRRPVRGWYIPGRMAAAAAEALILISGGRPRSRSVRTTVAKWLHDDAYDSTRFERDTGFVPALTLEQGVEREVIWLQEGAKGRRATP